MLIVGPITLLFPRAFFKAFYGCVGHRSRHWNGYRACLTLSFDCDYREDVEALPELLDMLAEYRFKASFACIGRWIERFPDEHRAILEYGHEILNHTYSHPNNEELNPDRYFNALSAVEQREEIAQCHSVCQDILDYNPIGFRTPHFGNLHTAGIYGILRELGYVYSSSVIAPRSPSFGLPYQTKESLLEFPVSCCPRHPFTCFDTWHCLRKPGAWHRKGDEFYRLFVKLIEVGITNGAYINLYFDPRDIVAYEANRKMWESLKALEADLWITNYADLVNVLSLEKGGVSS